MRRNAERASGVRTERDGDRTACNRGRRPRRRTAGDAVQAPRILDSAARGIEAGGLVGQLSHLSEPDAIRAGLVQPVQQIAVPDDPEIARFGEPAARPMRRRSQHVLGGVGQAIQRATETCFRRLNLYKRIQLGVERAGSLACTRPPALPRGRIERSPIGNAAHRATRSLEGGAPSILARAVEARESACDSVCCRVFLGNFLERSGVRNSA